MPPTEASNRKPTSQEGWETHTSQTPRQNSLELNTGDKAWRQHCALARPPKHTDLYEARGRRSTPGAKGIKDDELGCSSEVEGALESVLRFGSYEMGKVSTVGCSSEVEGALESVLRHDEGGDNTPAVEPHYTAEGPHPANPHNSRSRPHPPPLTTAQQRALPLDSGPGRPKPPLTPAEKEPSWAPSGRPARPPAVGEGLLRREGARRARFRPTHCARSEPRRRGHGRRLRTAALPATSHSPFPSPKPVAPLRLRCARSRAAAAMLNPYGATSGGDRVEDSGIGS
ncbi:hypothetical protein ABFV05_017330 [Capra hircus]